MNLSPHARRQVEKQSAEVVDRELPELGPFHRRVLTALLARTAEGWHLFVAHNPLLQADAFLVGPGGVFAVVIAEEPPDEATAGAVVRHTEERFAGVRGPRGQVLARSAIHLVVIRPGGSAGKSGLYWSIAEPQLPGLFQRDARHLDRHQVDSVADQAAERLPDYRHLIVRPPDRAPAPTGLLDVEDLTVDQLAAAQQRPFDTWLTFLHPHQQAVVTRNYNGPARISGPAGTGKTVVALHRLRHLARRSVGPLLFTTFVRTLPLVHKASFQRLAPELVDRVEFTNLHAWVREFLDARGRGVNVDSGAIRTAFSRAWVTHRGRLETLEKNSEYWHTEVDRVIKGRGVRTFEEYARLVRRGRTLRLDTGQRELVWQLYLSYQGNLAERQLNDYNDMISVALEELRRQPLDEPYAAVVVDEVQDIPLLGLRMLLELAGDGPNRLLLVGDGQQQVYPGGWRLSDAGIPIQGRGEVLRVNYRNRAEVLGFAQRFDATNQVDDLDGAAGVALRDVESANSGGEIRSWRGPEHELPDALLRALAESTVPTGRTALIVFQHEDLKRCVALLRKAGIPLLNLDHYEGDDDDRLKVGTVHRAKGLDFQAVLVVQFAAKDPAGSAAEQEQTELRGRQHLVAATRARDYLWWGVVSNA